MAWPLQDLVLNMSVKGPTGQESQKRGAFVGGLPHPMQAQVLEPLPATCQLRGICEQG